MIKIRLSRAGTVKRPFYHVMVADNRKPRDGRSIERIGHFNPLEKKIVINLARVEHWVSKGAQLSERVASLLEEMKEAGQPEQV